MERTLREQFAILKPNDHFVADMMRHLSEKYDAPQCANLKVKVVHYSTLGSWMELWSLAEPGLDRERLAKEYRETPEMGGSDSWRNVNGFLFQGAVQDTSTGKIAFADEDQRNQMMIERGLNGEVAKALSPFDAVIFVNDSNIKEAFKAGQPFPLHVVLTHECINLVERRTGQTFIKDFDAKNRYYDDPSAENLGEFVDKIGRNEFVRRYLTKP